MWEWKVLLRWHKKHLSPFLKGSVAKNCVRPESMPLESFDFLAYFELQNFVCPGLVYHLPHQSTNLIDLLNMSLFFAKMFFVCCQIYVILYTTLMNQLETINGLTLKLDELVQTILHGDKNFGSESNFKITGTIKFIKRPQRFEKPLFWTTVFWFSLSF